MIISLVFCCDYIAGFVSVGPTLYVYHIVVSIRSEASQASQTNNAVISMVSTEELRCVTARILRQWYPARRRRPNPPWSETEVDL